MAAETAETANNTRVIDSAVDNLSFSVDSLHVGDSTRSLLSPLYDSDRESLKEQSLHSGEEISEGEIDKSTSNKSSSDDDYSETVTVKKGKGNGGRSKGSSSSHSTSNSTYSSSTPTRSKEIEDETGFRETELSPWEKWLLTKAINEHERAKNDTKKKKLEKEMVEKKKAEKEEKERKAELNRQEWLKLKNSEEKIKNELKRREENMRAQKEKQEKDKVQQKAEETYTMWYEMKENERKERTKSKRKDERTRREKENERKQRSQEAYEKWLEKAKKHQKSTNNHFGYLSGRVTGYYDWTCYPMPSYNNPNPWVSPKIRTKYLGKMELQNASPPLLFKELEEREKNARCKSSKLKSKKSV